MSEKSGSMVELKHWRQDCLLKRREGAQNEMVKNRHSLAKCRRRGLAVTLSGETVSLSLALSRTQYHWTAALMVVCNLCLTNMGSGDACINVHHVVRVPAVHCHLYSP